MFKTSFEYSANTVISLILTSAIIVPFYLLFGNTLNIWTAAMVLGTPHSIFAALGYLGSDFRRVIIPFMAAFFVGVVLSVIFYSLPTQISYVGLILYFTSHILLDEQMFEGIIKNGYRGWQTSWSTILSWSLIVSILLMIVIAALYHMKVGSWEQFLVLWALLLFFLGLVVFEILKERQTGNNVPWGFVFFFVFLLVPVVLIFSRFWHGEGNVVFALISIFHFISWYIFYTKKLVRYPKENKEFGIRDLLFGWRINARRFLLTAALLQTLWIILLIVFLYQMPFSYMASYLVAAKWAPFLTIVHVTTSFLPNKPIKLRLGIPNFNLKIQEVKAEFKE